MTSVENTRSQPSQRKEASERQGHLRMDGTDVPILSITIPLSGEPYDRVAKAMAIITGATITKFPLMPHVTLQQVYSLANIDLVTASIEQLGRTIEPFELQISGLGLLSSPGELDRWHLHLHVQRCAAILQVYKQMTACLKDLGLRTYTYSPDDWIPHLTLASGSFSKRELRQIIRKLEAIPTVLKVLVDCVDLHRIDEDGRWSLVRRVNLGNSN